MISHTNDDEPTPMTVTDLKPLRRDPELVELHIDGELHATIAFAAASAERLRVGDVIPAEQLHRLLAVDEHWKAKQSALSLLAARARATGELAGRLRRKGFSGGAIQAALGDIERLGLLDDVAFAESWVRDRLKLRPRGSEVLVVELRRKCIPADIARAAVARVMTAEDVSDDDLCLAAAERWAAAHAPAAAGPSTRPDESRRLERKLSGFLARRGYRADTIRNALNAVLRLRPQ